MGEFSDADVARNVIAFRRPVRALHPAAPVALHAGHIVFFTGVRYERMAESASANPDGPHSDDGASANRKKRRRA